MNRMSLSLSLLPPHSLSLYIYLFVVSIDLWLIDSFVYVILRILWRQGQQPRLSIAYYPWNHTMSGSRWAVKMDFISLQKLCWFCNLPVGLHEPQQLSLQALLGIWTCLHYLRNSYLSMVKIWSLKVGWSFPQVFFMYVNLKYVYEFIHIP